MCFKYYDNISYLIYFIRFFKFIFQKKKIKKINDDYIIINICPEETNKTKNFDAGEIIHD
jgi:hypothetical protein